jgi:hypothetical protein
MAILSIGNPFGATDTVTSTKLNNIANAAEFDDPVDEETLELITTGVDAGKLRVKAGGVDFSKLTDVNNDDTMSNASATTLATSESIKAYVDEYSLKYSGATGTINVVGAYVYADLDLSATVGSNRALVILEVEGGSTAASIFFRTKGSTVKPYGSNSLGGWGASGGVISGANDGSVITVITDSNGVIAYTAGTAVTGISYTVQAYQKLA